MIKDKSLKEKEKLVSNKKDKKLSKKSDLLSVKLKEVTEEMPSLEEMLKQGVHFGHRTSKWNSRMEQYIFTTRNNIHIIDLEKTYDKLKQALNFIQNIKKKKGTIIFVGTKVAVKEITKKIAEESKVFHITERWIGGTLTNFSVISKRLEYFRNLEERKKKGELKKYVKKEQHEFDIELQKLEKQFGGIKNMTKMPDALLVVDTHKEKLAVKEARMKNIPIIGLCDTNADPTIIDYPIPMNDDSISSLKLILETIAKILK